MYEFTHIEYEWAEWMRVNGRWVLVGRCLIDGFDDFDWMEEDEDPGASAPDAE